MVPVIETSSTTTNVVILAPTGPYGFSCKKLRRKCTDLEVHSGTRPMRSLRSETSNPKQLEILIVAVKFMQANLPLNEELLVHSTRFVDSWIEETFI